MSQDIEAFQREMESQGLACPDPIVADGKIHRFYVDGDRPNSKNGWYRAFNDECPFIMFGSWRTGEQFTWSMKSAQSLSPQEQQRHKERMAKGKEESERVRVELAREAAINAQRIWNGSNPASPHHRYLKRKGTKAHGIRECKGTLIVPVYDKSDSIMSLQFIKESGEKKFLTDGAIKGHYFSIGKWTETIYICEGFATGATIHEVTGLLTVVAFNAGNLKPVAEAVRQKHPNAQIIIACDNDRKTKGNPGLTKGREAADVIHGTVVSPTFQNLGDSENPPTDFNDLMILEGVEEVKKQLQSMEDMEIVQEQLRPQAEEVDQPQDMAPVTTDEMKKESVLSRTSQAAIGSQWPFLSSSMPENRQEILSRMRTLSSGLLSIIAVISSWTSGLVSTKSRSSML